MAPIEAGRHRRPASSFPASALAVIAVVVLVGACGGRSATPTPVPTRSASPSPTVGGPPPTAEPTTALTPVRLRLRGAPDATAAGYLAAVQQGYYEAEGLDVTLVPGDLTTGVPGAGGPPAAGGPAAAEFTVAWVPTILAARDAGDSDLVNIAQLVQRSGTLSMAWKSEGITTPADLRDKRLGILAAGSDLEITAALVKAGLTPVKDVKSVETGPDVDAFLHGDVDAAQAMIYDQYAQVLESPDPKTGALYAPTALDVINYNDVGTAMLQDAILARSAWLQDTSNEDLANGFLQATFEGWIYCREHPDHCGEPATARGERRAGRRCVGQPGRGGQSVADRRRIGGADPRDRPSGLDAERVRSAHLAIPGRDRRGRCGRVAVHGRRPAQRGPDRRRPARRGLSDRSGESSACPVDRYRHDGQRVREGHRGDHPGRQLAGGVVDPRAGRFPARRRATIAR
jgi:NitT/TauT family transport system substrate-binding protein